MSRMTKSNLFDHMSQWNTFLNKKVRLVACGGTAMTLLGVKASTKDVDFMVPDDVEREHLIKTLKNIGYKQETNVGWLDPREMYRFDLFQRNYIHTTELLESPLLDGRHTILEEYERVVISVLNFEDLIVSKLFRGTEVDFDDCVMLVRTKRDSINLKALADHFSKMLSFHPVGENRVKGHWDSFERMLIEEGLHE